LKFLAWLIDRLGSEKGRRIRARKRRLRVLGYSWSMDGRNDPCDYCKTRRHSIRERRWKRPGVGVTDLNENHWVSIAAACLNCGTVGREDFCENLIAEESLDLFLDRLEAEHAPFEVVTQKISELRRVEQHLRAELDRVTTGRRKLEEDLALREAGSKTSYRELPRGTRQLPPKSN